MKNESKEKIIKGLSKAISIISEIIKVFTIIGAVGIVLAMIIVPIVFNKIEIKDNSIIYDKTATINITDDDKVISIKYKDEVIATEQNQDAILEFKEWLNNNSKSTIVTYIELACFLGLIVLAITYMVFRRLRKLFNNIHDGDTPFTLENVEHIKRIAYLLIAAIVVPSFVGGIFSAIINKSFNINIGLCGVIEILFLFSMVYIFEYGYELQTNSKQKIYTDKETK